MTFLKEQAVKEGRHRITDLQTAVILPNIREPILFDFFICLHARDLARSEIPVSPPVSLSLPDAVHPRHLPQKDAEPRCQRQREKRCCAHVERISPPSLLRVQGFWPGLCQENKEVICLPSPKAEHIPLGSLM